MQVNSRRAWATLGTAALATALIVAPTQAGAATRGPDGFTATALSPSSTITGTKSTSGRLATSDTALLKRTDSKLVNVVVKLDYDAMASYRGGIKGLPATSPSVTGKRLTGKSASEKTYQGHISSMDKAFRSALASKLPGAKAGKSLTTVYGGVALRLPANQAAKLLSLPGVAAVQADTLNKPDATPSATLPEDPEFIGAPTLWRQLGGQDLAGKGVIFADLDTGIWPEHPMLADNPAIGAPSAAPSGVARPCVFGDNPLTPAVDVFQCNDKVIGGASFLTTYNSLYPGELYADTARDADGHGTHTTTTAAGDAVVKAPVLGVDQGPVSGVAPGAWVLEYKVCGLQGCFGSDSAAAVGQAILDGANVINFSISGGSNPYGDPVELAFLDAYNAGVFVAASAGNSGPAAGTTDHHSPWVTTVAASTLSRAFETTLTVSSGGASQTFTGTSLTAGVTTPAPIVMAGDISGYGDPLCLTPVPAGAVTGKVVACKRGTNARIDKGYNVLQGGAVGMILYNPTLADTESDNHWLPAVHLADGTQFLAFMGAHPDSMASWPAGSKAPAQGDVMAAFSSRGPGGQFLKPDITAPGVQILAGNTPTPFPGDTTLGPPGEYYQAIAGTSMSSPGIAGSAILVKAAHMGWTPGAIKSALMTTATTDVVKEDQVTHADPFDDGAGRVDLTKAGKAPVVFDESAANLFYLGQNAVTAVDLNLPSVNVPTMPGTVTVHRTATNVSGRAWRFTAHTTAPAGTKIKVYPRTGYIPAGGSQTFSIVITSSAPTGQYFGEVRFTAKGATAVHLPVAFKNQQGAVSLTSTCDPSTISVGDATTCTVTAENKAPGPATVSMTSTVSPLLKITDVVGDGTLVSDKKVTAGPTVLAPPKDAIPAIDPGDTPGGPPYGFLDLRLFGIAPVALGDETATNFTVPGFDFGGRTYSSIGVVSDGYIVINGAHGQQDIAYIPQHLPDAAAPNGVLAPYWSDLDGTGEEGARVTLLGDGVDTWLVVQWDVHVFGDASQHRSMQVWIGVNGVEDISYGYADATIGALGSPEGLTVGAENLSGTAGAQITGAPTGSYVITTTPGEPGESLTYTLTVKGNRVGNRSLTTDMTADVVPGTTTVVTPIRVTR